MCCTWPLTHSYIQCTDLNIWPLHWGTFHSRGETVHRGQRSTEEWERRCNRAAVPSLNGPQPCSEEVQLTACNRPAIHLQQHWQAIWTPTTCCLRCSAINDVFLVRSVFSVNMQLLLVALQWWSREDRKQCLKERGSTISSKVKWGLSSIVLIQQHCQVSRSHPILTTTHHSTKTDKYYDFLFVSEIPEKKSVLVQADIWQTLLHVFYFFSETSWPRKYC